MIAETSEILPWVTLGAGCRVEDFCVIGATGHGGDGEQTEIGSGAVIRSATVIYEGNRIGPRFQTGNKANIREHNRIGADVSIGALSIVEHHVTIGNRVRVHSHAFIPEFSVIADDCWLGPGAVLTNARFPASADAKSRLEGPVLERRAIIGAHATILPGVVIGEGSLVGAGSVVTRDVPPGVIVAGNPATVLRSIDY